MPVRRRVNPQARRRIAPLRRRRSINPQRGRGGRRIASGTVTPARRRNPQRGRATQARAPARLRSAVSAAMRTPQITRRGGRLGGPTRRRANPQRSRRY